MCTFKEKLNEIVSKSLFSCHGDIAERNFLVLYGPWKYEISVNKILDICKDDREQSIDSLLSSCHQLQDVSDDIFIGKIRLMDSIHNHLCSFNIRKESEPKQSFEPRLYENLRMVDGYMPRLLEAIVNIVTTSGVNKSSEILINLITSNPIHMAVGWEENTYRFKFGRLLYNFVLGMTEEKAWDGRVSNGGILCFNGSTCRGFCFYDQTSIGNFLIASTELFIHDSHCCFILSAP